MTDEVTIGVVIKTSFIQQRVTTDGSSIGGTVLVLGTITFFINLAGDTPRVIVFRLGETDIRVGDASLMI